jgi:hypothetical protein
VFQLAKRVVRKQEKWLGLLAAVTPTYHSWFPEVNQSSTKVYWVHASDKTARLRFWVFESIQKKGKLGTIIYLSYKNLSSWCIVNSQLTHAALQIHQPCMSLKLGLRGREWEGNSVKRGRRQEDGFLAFTLLEVVTRGWGRTVLLHKFIVKRLSSGVVMDLAWKERKRG